MTPKYKANLERNIDVCKLNIHNKSQIRHNRSTMMPRGLSPTRKQAVKTWEEAFVTQNCSREIVNSNINILQETFLLDISLNFLSYTFIS